MSTYFKSSAIDNAIESKFIALLDECEFARYAPASNKNAQMDAVLEKAKNIIIEVLYYFLRRNFRSDNLFEILCDLNVFRRALSLNSQPSNLVNSFNISCLDSLLMELPRAIDLIFSILF